MARQRNPDRDRARDLWLEDTERPLKDIALELNLPEVRIRKWKSEGKWEKERNGTREKERSDSKRLAKKLVATVEENEQLTEKEKAFCLRFVKSFNAAAAARAAGYESKWAARIGWELLQKPHIKAEVQRLKEIRNLAMLAGPDDVVELHMRIAFADMTDFAYFGNGVVGLNNSDDVDGQLVSEVKAGDNGPSIKLRSADKSMAFLERYFTLNPMDRHKKAFDEARLEIERSKQPAHDDEEEATGVIVLPVLMEVGDE